MNRSAVFGKDGAEFIATLDHFTVDGTGSHSRTARFGFTIRNSGTKGTSFVAYPKIIDSLGTGYTAERIFLESDPSRGNRHRNEFHYHTR